MKKIFIVLLLSGCAPYAELGAGYNLESGHYGWSESCILGLYGAGLEGDKWTLAYQHTSCIDNQPEIVTNQLLIKRKFGGL